MSIVTSNKVQSSLTNKILMTVSVSVQTLFYYAFQAEIAFVNKLYEMKPHEQKQEIQRYEQQKQTVQAQQVHQVHLLEFQALQKQKQRLIQVARDDIAKKSKPTFWADDDESEMDFSKPFVYQSDDMDLSE